MKSWVNGEPETGVGDTTTAETPLVQCVALVIFAKANLSFRLVDGAGAKAEDGASVSEAEEADMEDVPEAAATKGL